MDILKTKSLKVTAKVVEKQHNDAIAQIDNLIELAKKHYNLAA
jgi:phage regulator Rha-like protein